MIFYDLHILINPVFYFNYNRLYQEPQLSHVMKILTMIGNMAHLVEAFLTSFFFLSFLLFINKKTYLFIFIDSQLDGVDILFPQLVEITD